MGPFAREEVPDARSLRRADRRSATIVCMGTPCRAAATALLLTAAVACGSRPAELVPPIGKPSLVDASAEFPKIRFGDGLVSASDRCPITKRKLSIYFPPVYVNGLPIGFC
jgi:hypothetical protein